MDTVDAILFIISNSDVWCYKSRGGSSDEALQQTTQKYKSIHFYFDERYIYL